MKLTSEELKSLYQEGTARSAVGRAECLTAEAIMRAANAELNLAERERVVDHLATCSDCAREFRLALALKPWAEKIEQGGTASADPALHPGAVAKRPLFRGVEKILLELPTRWQRFAPVLSPARAAFTLAALLLTLLALGVWLVLTQQGNNSQIARLQGQLAERDRALGSAEKSLDEARRQLEETIRRSGQDKSDTTSKQYEEKIARLRRSISELSKPQLETPIVDLDPGGTIRGRPKEGTTMIEVPKTANLVTLILNFSGQKQYSNYEVEVFDQSGHKVWHGRSALLSQTQSLNVTFSRRLLLGGQYLIKLFGLRDRKKELIADYAMTIRYK